MIKTLHSAQIAVYPLKNHVSRVQNLGKENCCTYRQKKGNAAVGDSPAVSDGLSVDFELPERLTEASWLQNDCTRERMSQADDALPRSCSNCNNSRSILTPLVAIMLVSQCDKISIVSFAKSR
jgi:hypothetical protein